MKTIAQDGIREQDGLRKAAPVYDSVLRYFPNAITAVAEVARVGNDQHNPGQPMKWAVEKSTDEGNALMSHLLKRAAGYTWAPEGTRHLAHVAWRALAMLEREIIAENTDAANVFFNDGEVGHEHP